MSDVIEIGFVDWSLSDLADSAEKEVYEGEVGESSGILAGLLKSFSERSLEDLYVLNAFNECLSGLSRRASDIYASASRWADRLLWGSKNSGDKEFLRGFCMSVSRGAQNYEFLRGRFV